MSCRELADLLMDYVAGELEAAHRADLDDHLCRCPECVALVRTYTVTVRFARCLEQKPLPDGFAARLTSVLHVEYRRSQGESS